MEILVCAVHPFASVIVNEKVPAVRVKFPMPLYGVVPPLPLTATVVLPPKHRILPDVAFAVNWVGWLRLVFRVMEQPFASVTVTV